MERRYVLLLSDIVTTTDSPNHEDNYLISNPFEEQASIFLSVGKRRFKERCNKCQDKDPDIAGEITKHGKDNVKIIYDSNHWQYKFGGMNHGVNAAMMMISVIPPNE